MRPGPIQKLHTEPGQQERGAPSNGLEQTTAKAARAPERDTPSRQSEIPTPDISTAVERKNDAGKPERESIAREPVVREQVRRRQPATPPPPADDRPSATSPDHSRDKSAISPETDAVPMRRLPIDSIIEEASQYHPDRARSFNFRLRSEALGSQDPDFIWGLVGQLADASTRFNDGEGLNFMLSVIKNIHPRDCIDAMLGAQMVAVHMSMMNYVDELARLDHTPQPQQEMAERTLNKLSRTFATLVGAFKHYRTSGEQKLAVGQVSVSHGGQAIVGTVNQTPRDVLPEKSPNATPALTDGRQTAMEMVGERKRKPVLQRRERLDD